MREWIMLIYILCRNDPSLYGYFRALPGIPYIAEKLKSDGNYCKILNYVYTGGVW